MTTNLESSTAGIDNLVSIMSSNSDSSCTSNWCDLSRDLVDRILSMVEDDMDMVRCRDVCLSWRAAASEVYLRRGRIPKLLFGDDDGFHLRDVFRLRDEYLPEEDCYGSSSRRRWICNSTNGWLLMYEFHQLEASFSLCLCNPISKREVALPLISVAKYATILKTRPKFFLELGFIRKGITSTSPLGKGSSMSFLVLIICGGGIDPRLAFCGSGDGEWKFLELEGSNSDIPSTTFVDLVRCRGQFYAVDEQGKVYRYELEGSDPRVIEEGMPYIQYGFSIKYVYLVESLLGELLLVFGKRKYLDEYEDQEGEEDQDGLYGNASLSDVSFEVYEVELATNSIFIQPKILY